MQQDYSAFVSFLKQKMFPSSAALEIEEISEGNINHIYRATDCKTGRSVILKQAQEVSRISPEIRLNPDRGRREAAYFEFYSALVPYALPEIYAFDETLHLIVMQDLKECPVLRKAMLAGTMSAHLGNHLGAFVAETAFASSDFVLPHPEKKQMQTRFSNPELCALTEKLVFSDPFLGDKDNSVSRENAAFLETRIYQNERLLAKAAALKFRFMNASQALIHGDLHFGSVFLKGELPVVFDPEFCFFGPIGFDLGNALAHFVMEYFFVKLSRPQDDAFLSWLKAMAHELVFSFSEAFTRLAEQQCKDAVLRSPGFVNTFVSSVLRDTAGFAGVECLRRTIGIAKIPEFDLLSAARRAQFERNVMDAGVLLMERGSEIQSATALVDLIERLYI